MTPWRKVIDQHDDEPSALDSAVNPRTFTQEADARRAEAARLTAERARLAAERNR